MSRPLQILLVVAVAAAGLAAGYFAGRGPAPAQAPDLENATLFPTPRAVPEFALVDQDGRPFRRSDLAGRWSLLFFGFTHCPDVCPSTLATLAAARRELADLPEPLRPRVVLVTVDPERDTAEALKTYVAFFDPSFTGVTGEAAAISTLTAQLGVAVRQGPRDEDGNYTVDHTAAVFLVDPDGALAGIFSTPHTPDGIAHDYRRILEAKGVAS
jgi:protein SCO1/2